MPRDIPIGNGRLLINFDCRYQIRDFYYPHVGGENQSGGYPFRFGVWCDGMFSWTSSAEWNIKMDYDDETLVTSVILQCDRLALTLNCNDAVDFHESIYLRRVRVVNHNSVVRDVRVFFHQDFRIMDFDIGDTAFYQPEHNYIVHYKESRYFLINCLTEDGSGIRDFATGVKGQDGKEGTWRDAEGDGELSKNPIAQGSVDSIISTRVRVNPASTAELYYWICVDTTYEGVKTLNQVVMSKSPSELIKRTAAYWNLWLNKDEYDFSPLPDDIVRLYKRSMLILRTQIDANGAIVAANDSDITQFARDTYSYVWPRDGALVARSLDLAGYNEIAANFYSWCAKSITKEGYFLHKYNPDGSVGSSWHPWIVGGHQQLPIQEDETALVLWALWKHFDRYRDIEMIKPLYKDLVIRSAEWMAGYSDYATKLPLPSYDLWEERRGVLAWTVGSVYGGLIAAANFAQCFGESARADRYRSVADEVKAGVEKYLWHAEWNRFVRMINFDDSGAVVIDGNIDASMVGLFQFGMFEASDPRIQSTMQAIRERLWVKTQVGGMARYEDDYYHQVSKDIGNVAGNPWFVCTLWLADYTIAKAANLEELKEALSILSWCVNHALPSGVLAEQVNPYNDDPISVSPLTWSHAGYVRSVLAYLDRLSSFRVCSECGQPLYARELPKQRRDHDHCNLERLPEACPPAS